MQVNARRPAERSRSSSATSSCAPIRRAGPSVRLRDVARIELGALQYSSTRASSATTRRSCSPSSRCRARTRSTCSSTSRTRWRSCRSASPRASTTRMHYDTTRFVSASMHDVLMTLAEALLLVIAGRLHLPAELAHDAHPDHRHSGVADRDAGRDAGARLLAQHAEPARHGAGDRARRRRRHRGGRERRAAARSTGCSRSQRRARPRWRK